MIIPGTFLSVNEHLTLFLLSCLFGLAIGVFYDIFRVIRILIPHNNFLVILEDIIFMCVYVIFIVSFTSVVANGDFRIFFIIGNILGFGLYFFTVGNLFISILKRIIYILKSILSFVLKPFYILSLFICRKLRCIFGTIYKVFKKFTKRCFRHLKESYEMLYNKRVINHRRNVNGNGKKKEESKKTRQKKDYNSNTY